MLAGQTVAALVPIADAVGYGVSLDVVAKYPVPASEATTLELAPDAIEPVIDYAQHLAAFKLGGDGFTATQGLLESFLSAAGVQNAKAVANAAFVVPLRDRGTLDEAWRPRVAASAEGA